MIRIQGSKSVICSKKELEMIEDLFFGISYCFYYELPLFSLDQSPKSYCAIETDYVLIRPNNKKLTDSFFDRINKTWNKLYENRN